MRKLLLLLLSVILLTACQKQITKKEQKVGVEQTSNVAARNGADKIDVCHLEGNGSYHTINIDINALSEHLAHGDIVPDVDGDGYTKENPCGNGSQNDCDDDNPAINPGSIEICGNNIDDNCDGQIDEECTDFVTICDQVWMRKNLDVAHYRNGDPIPQVTDPSEWSGLTTGAWAYYENDPDNGAVYGKLYNWYAVNDPRGLAPVGWHIPSEEEWDDMINCLGGTEVAGGKLKSTGTIEASTGLWYSPNTDASNLSGFTALPGASFNQNGHFQDIGYYGVWWSSTIRIISLAPWMYSLSSEEATVQKDDQDMREGFSVRCIKD